jgi:hypothetical protein
MLFQRLSLHASNRGPTKTFRHVGHISSQRGKRVMIVGFEATIISLRIIGLDMLAIELGLVINIIA